MGKTTNYTFVANETKEYEGGRSFFIHEAGGAFDLTVEFLGLNGRRIHRAEGVGASYRYVLPSSEEMFYSASITAKTGQTVKFEISEHGESGSMVIAGEINSIIVQGDTLSESVVNVGTVATAIAGANSSRKAIHVLNESANDVYIGSSGVTTGNGAIKLAPGEEMREETLSAAAWYGIAAAASDVRVLVGE